MMFSSRHTVENWYMWTNQNLMILCFFLFYTTFNNDNDDDTETDAAYNNQFLRIVRLVHSCHAVEWYHTATSSYYLFFWLKAALSTGHGTVIFCDMGLLIIFSKFHVIHILHRNSRKRPSSEFGTSEAFSCTHLHLHRQDRVHYHPATQSYTLVHNWKLCSRKISTILLWMWCDYV